MQPRVRSRTAEVTAAIRACHYLHDQPLLFEDPYALYLTSGAWRTVARSPLLHTCIVRGLLGRLRPVHGWILVRDRVTDDALRAFVEAGYRQFVLLGAGFDSTALRHPPWLDGVRVFEVDHPATQAVKMARIGRLGVRMDPATFEAVPVDFEHESLATGLARSSFDPGQPTLFAWQGVIYYLTDVAIRQTLADINRLAAPGSELLFDFLLPGHALEAGRGGVLSWARHFTARLGERYISYHDRAAVDGLLADAGMQVLSVRLDRELEQEYVVGRDDDLAVMHGFGIAHARKPLMAGAD